MSNEKNSEVLQHVLQYYRAKCSQLEYDFLLYRLSAEETIKELQEKQKSEKSDAKTS